MSLIPYKNIKFLSPEEEHSLAIDYFENKNVEAAHALAISHLPFVAKVAWRYHFYFKIPIEDLVQEGIVGLMRAIKAFNPYMGSRLLSFAHNYIFAAIKEHVIYNWSLVKLGTTTEQRNTFFKALNLSKETFIDDKNPMKDFAVRIKQKDYFLDAPFNSETTDTFLDLVESNGLTPEVMIINKDTKKHVLNIIKKLTPNEQRVIREKYLSEERHTLQSIANLMGISKQRVDQLEKKALRKLKRFLIESEVT